MVSSTLHCPHFRHLCLYSSRYHTATFAITILTQLFHPLLITTAPFPTAFVFIILIQTISFPSLRPFLSYWLSDRQFQCCYCSLLQRTFVSLGPLSPRSPSTPSTITLTLTLSPHSDKDAVASSIQNLITVLKSNHEYTKHVLNILGEQFVSDESYVHRFTDSVSL